MLSDYLLEQYLTAASRSVDKAVRFGEQPRNVKEVFSPNDLCNRKFHFRPQIWFEVNADGRYVDIGHGDRESRRLYAKRYQGAPADGRYTIRIEASAIGREHPYEPEILRMDSGEPLKAELIVTDPSVGNPGSRTNASDRTVAVIPIADNEKRVYEVSTWMDQGYVPIVVFANGPQPFKGTLMKLVPKHHLDVVPSNWRSGTDTEPAEERDVYLSDVYAGPRLRVYSISVEGPHYTQWPPESHYAALGSGATEPDGVEPSRVIAHFAARAFRRPLRQEEQVKYEQLYERLLSDGVSRLTAIKTTLAAILVSPSFLYFESPSADETESPSSSNEDQYTLASRLSYFLWSSMPDDELLAAAERGELSAAHELRRHAMRMLRDERSRGFVEQFTDSWLRLNKLGSMPPDEGKFATYYEQRLQPLMKEETRAFFHHMLKANRPIDEFLHSDYTFLNRNLANLYGIEGVHGDHFRLTRLPDNSERGGLLGHASVLTTTSNGVETSPVTRGVWVLENLLGTPPSPPPPDVAPLEPDIRGATTIREQLAKHRNDAACNSCHQKIDPLGFALEVFDPIGRQRTAYHVEGTRRELPLDTAGELPSGERFENLRGLKEILLNRNRQFARCLTEKLLTYALGRELAYSDRTAAADIVEQLQQRGGGLQDLIELIVASKTFRSI